MPMKTRLGPSQSQPLDRPVAWACLASNLLVLPGLGSVTAGRRIGYAQMGVALVGFGLTGIWFVWFMIQWIHSEEMPTVFGPYFWTCCLGVTLSALAWSWALASSIGILKDAYSQEEK